MPMEDLPQPELARNFRLLGHSDISGRGDGIQVMVHRGFAYVGHLFSRGFSVVDVRDPRAPKPVRHLAAPPNSWNVHLQTADDLLLVANDEDAFASQAAAEGGYRQGGLAVYDLSDPAEPRRIGFMAVPGGVHRIWFVGGRWAYVSAWFEGFSDFALLVVDLADPAHPRPAGRFWLEGMNRAAGEIPAWPAGRQVGLHHAVVHGDKAYGSWRDAGLVVIDVADKDKPALVAHRNWSPPFGGGTHNALPLPGRDLLIVLDEATQEHQGDGVKLGWVFDIRDLRNPVSIATFPSPADADYAARAGNFGPHNLHENRPGSFVSEEVIFTAYQNAGVRVFDVRDPFRPIETAAFVPQAPHRMIDPRPGAPRVVQTADVFVDAQGLAYVTDHNAGLYILEYGG